MGRAMTQASKLRSFAITAEHVATLVPKLALSRAIPRSESELLVKRLKEGAEVALDIAQDMERKA